MEKPSSRTSIVRAGAVLRDVAIIVVLTAIGGFIVGLTAPPGSPRGVLAIALSNLFFGTIGFIISGCLAKGNRWRHLLWVAFGTWLAGLINVFLFGFGMGQWFFSLLAVLLMMGLGGGLSYFYLKDNPPPD